MRRSSPRPFLTTRRSGWHFDASIEARLAEAVGEKLTALLGSGESLNDATAETKNDFGLRVLEFVLTISSLFNKSVNLDLLDGRKRVTSEEYYWVDPDERFGVARVVPSYGPPGTSVVYEVTVNSRFAGQVASIDFDIDNTGENIDMVRVNSTFWQRDGLSAPTPSGFPRVDTFTFNARDASGAVIGRGNATFTIVASSLALRAPEEGTAPPRGYRPDGGGR